MTAGKTSGVLASEPAAYQANVFRHPATGCQRDLKSYVYDFLCGAVRPFQRLVERNKPQPTDLIFSKTHRQLFNTILEEEGLKKDREGQSRTAYSLRHTYICLRLMEGADIYQIAKNCRTSVEMIEKYYASHLKNSLDAAAINIRHPKKKKNERPTEQEG
jgi:integrase